MARQQSVDDLTVEQRMEIFRELVEAQDKGMGVAASRRHLSERFHISEADIQKIEREGLDALWPPLN